MALLRGLGAGVVLGAAYGVLLTGALTTASLVRDGGLAALTDLASWLSLMVYASGFAVLLGGVLGGVAGAGLALALWYLVPPVSLALRVWGLRGRSRTVAAGAVASALGLVLLPSRVVRNTTLLLDGPADGDLQLVVGKLLPTTLMLLAAVRCWPHFVPGTPSDAGGTAPPDGPG